jgi:hypothetical protein
MIRSEACFADPMIASSSYQVILLGAIRPRADAVRASVERRLGELGLDPQAIVFIERDIAANWDRRLPVMALFFGDSPITSDPVVLDQLVADSVVIVPIVSLLSRVHQELPPQLHHVNALEYGNSDGGLDRLVSLVLETFRLLRVERRLFISYRREDAHPFAERLYDALDSRGFDVFIDVRSVPPAVDFQSALWHRMSDSDVVVLVDTPGFRASRWTTAELARANATNIQILHLLWPGQTEDASSSFSHFMKLESTDFEGGIIARGEGATTDVLTRICSEVERLRARAIAARHRYLVDNFCDAARDLGMSPAVQPERWIAVARPNGRTLAAIPAVGIPTSDRLNAIFDSVADTTSNTRDLWVIFDNRGLLATWLSHLDWLSTHLPIRAVRMSEAPDRLRELPA